MAAKTEAESAVEFAQDALSKAPVIILGSGASAAHGIPGMWPLATHLAGAVTPTGWNATENGEWSSLLAHLKSGKDLESALQEIRPSERQTLFVAESARAYLLPYDDQALTGLLADRRSLPLARLIRHLFSSTHRTLNIVTTNYDRLAEYAADAAEVAVHTGFSQGYLQTRASEQPAINSSRGSRTVCIWKVHGSLDWFIDGDNRIVGIRGIQNTPPGYRPLMITPGVEKYRLTHGEPFRTILGCSDTALEQARAYFCVGYGFNDEHVQTKLVDRCERETIPLVVITKELTPPAKAFLTGGRCRQYLALEEVAGGVRAYTHLNPSGFVIDGGLSWQLGEFLDLTIGAPS